MSDEGLGQRKASGQQIKVSVPVAADAVIASSKFAQGAKDPMIADVMSMSKSVGQLKRQMARMELRLREQSETIQNLEEEKVSVGKLDAGLAVKAHASDLNSVQRSIDALISALVDQIEEKPMKVKIARALAGAIPSKFTFSLLEEIEKDLVQNPEICKKEPESHTKHLKQLQTAVDKLQLENKHRKQALADLDTQSRFKTKQFSEFLRDKASTEVDMEEKQRAIQKDNLQQLAEEMEDQLADMNADVDLKMQKLAEENKQFVRKADVAAKRMLQGQELREQKDAELLDDISGLSEQVRALRAAQSGFQKSCDTISTEMDTLREPLVSEIRNMKEGNKTLLVELDRHGSAFRSVLGEFDLHRTEWFKKEGRNLGVGGSSSHPALRRSQNPMQSSSAMNRSQPNVRNLQPLRRSRGPLG
jgi:hypothetical protein